MDQMLLRKSAECLEEVINKYAFTDADVDGLYKSLSTLIADALAGKILLPMQWGDVPGAYGFLEGGLRQYRDLETAYAIFKIEVTGGKDKWGQTTFRKHSENER
ncbi:hypothetical protein NQF78_02615 [Pseudomonas monsensis]|uniref:Type II toxin-antitoxin system RelE/ParE family toxin n=1 Tax=Pseudomonas monsensis TaxID=2745509 RepID=A0ABT3YNW5_9PSED|nr:hypothetical protein [Pseudomonas monsensis]MCY0107186.1 hypothetical protein [Pseudomonas monsensis]